MPGRNCPKLFSGVRFARALKKGPVEEIQTASTDGRCPMAIRRTLVAIAVLATSSIVLAQTNETKPPDGNSGTPSNNSSTIPAPDPCRSSTTRAPAEILSDTMSVDFQPYLKKMLEVIKQNWIIGLPPSAYPPIWKQAKDSIDFTILKNGEVTGMVWHSGSGDIAMDRAAWGSIMGSNPLPPLPREFPGPNLGLRLNFLLNLSIHISPCAAMRRNSKLISVLNFSFRPATECSTHIRKPSSIAI